MRCAIGTIPVGGYVTIVASSRAHSGITTTSATVATDSTDRPRGNNQATGGWTVVPIDIQARETPERDQRQRQRRRPRWRSCWRAASTQSVVNSAASVCFGDAEDPAARTCREVRNTGHREDADEDRDIDLAPCTTRRGETGIDAGDTSACLAGDDVRQGGRSLGATRSKTKVTLIC